jgi:hypothetical protein|nr:MAG TPA: hypothetical protein [Caudoviricetes sp.]
MDEYGRRLTAVEERSKSNTHRIDELYKKQEEMIETIKTVAVMASEQAHIKADVSEIKSDVKKIMGRDGRRWEMVVEKVILLAVAAMVGYVLLKIGLQ